MISFKVCGVNINNVKQMKQNIISKFCPLIQVTSTENGTQGIFKSVHCPAMLAYLSASQMLIYHLPTSYPWLFDTIKHINKLHELCLKCLKNHDEVSSIGFYVVSCLEQKLKELLLPPCDRAKCGSLSRRTPRH